MEVRFADAGLERVYRDPSASGGMDQKIVKRFRQRVQHIRAAKNEQDFYGWRSVNFEKLKGRPGQYSMRLNDQWRLIVELENEGSEKTVVIITVEDYH